MSKKAEALVKQINDLVQELGKLAGVEVEKSSASSQKSKVKSKKEYSGTTGGIRMLIDDGYFSVPKVKKDVINKLAEEGRYYSNPSISMSLLNLVKERKLSRIGKKGSWKYVIRK